MFGPIYPLNSTNQLGRPVGRPTSQWTNQPDNQPTRAARSYIDQPMDQPVDLRTENENRISKWNTMSILFNLVENRN